MAVQTTIKLRRDTSANWASVNPVLAEGEQGLEKVTERIKIGDGVTAWNSLPYANVTQEDFLQTFFGYPASGYDTFPRINITSTVTPSNGTLQVTLFTPIKNITISNITSQTSTGRLDYGYTSNYRGMCIYSCSGINNTTLTPLAVTWDGDKYLWASTQYSGGTTGTVTSAVASNSGNYTLVTCTGTMSTAMSAGQWATVSGGTGGFTTFSGMVVGQPTTTSWIIQASGTNVVTGTMTGGSVTSAILSTTSPTISSGTIASGTGTVATVNLTCSLMTIPFSPGQWVNVTGSTNSVSGIVASSPLPTSTSFTLLCPSTLTSGSIGTGTATHPDAWGRYVRPLYVPTATGSGVVTPTTVTLNAGSTYAIGFLSYQTGGTTSTPSQAVGGSSSANGMVTPYLSLGLASQTTITNTAIGAGTISGATIWARLT